jgi:light-harvesting complex I chlorophyll a/b binding protein 1
MAQRLANKRAGRAAARATSPRGALLPNRRGPSAPSASSSSKGAETAAYLETLPGISAPFNKGFFDPLGLHKGASIPEVRRWREAELTHGRVAMLAALGFVVGEQLEDSSSFLLFDGNITGPAIGHYQQLGQGFWEPLLLAIGVCESYRVAVGWATPQGNGFNQLKEDYVPGDLDFDPLGLKPKDDEELYELQTKELNNGRLAMIGIAGFVAAELKSPGTEVFEHLFQILDYDLVKEVDLVEDIVGLPETPLPELDSSTLSNLGFK